MFFKKKKYHFYVVDDVPQMTDFLGSMITSHFDAKVIPVHSAPEVLAKLGKEKRLPDLIVSDQAMPDMTGLQLKNEIRDRGFKIPMIFVSGIEGDDVIEDQMVMLGKPINAKVLFAQMERMLDKSFVVS